MGFWKSGYSKFSWVSKSSQLFVDAKTAIQWSIRWFEFHDHEKKCCIFEIPSLWGKKWTFVKKSWCSSLFAEPLDLGSCPCLRGFVMMKCHCFSYFASWPSGFIKIHTEMLLSQWNGGDSDHGAGMNHRFPLGGHNWWSLRKWSWSMKIIPQFWQASWHQDPNFDDFFQIWNEITNCNSIPLSMAIHHTLNKAFIEGSPMASIQHPPCGAEPPDACYTMVRILPACCRSRSLRQKAKKSVGNVACCWFGSSALFWRNMLLFFEGVLFQ